MHCLKWRVKNYMTEQQKRKFCRMLERFLPCQIGCFHVLLSVPVCLVMIINNGTTDSRSCLTTELCQIGTTLQYKCDVGFTQSSSNTTCLEDHSWSKVPRCIDKGTLCIVFHRRQYNIFGGLRISCL